MRIKRLVARDKQEWLVLNGAVRNGAAPLRDAAAALRERDTLEGWRAFARTWILAREATASTRELEAWLVASWLELIDADDPSRLSLRLELLGLSFDPAQHLADAHALDAAWADAATPPTPAQRVELSLLLAWGELVARDYAEGARHAQHALEVARDRGLLERYYFAQRRLAAALTGCLQITKAFSLFNIALTRPAPPLPGASLRGPYAPEPSWDAALADLVAVSAWASPKTPELVGIIGTLAERCPDPAAQEDLWERFTPALERLLPGEDAKAEHDLLNQVLRSFFAQLPRAAEAALQVFHARHPDHAWGAMQLEQIKPRAEVARLAALLPGLRRAEAIDRLLRFVEALDQAGTLAESELGFYSADLLLNALLADKDERAIAAQQRLLDAKLRRWGECPAAWQELQNLGTVYIHLGRYKEARATLKQALRNLQADQRARPRVELYDDDDYRDDNESPHASIIAMIRRNLERLDEAEKGQE